MMSMTTHAHKAVRTPMGMLLVACLMVLSLMALRPAHADAPPVRYPLVPIEAGQDGEDVAMGITDYYADFEAYQLTFETGEGAQDHNGVPLAKAVSITVDRDLATEMGWAEPTPDGASSGGPHTIRLEAPDLGWAIPRSYTVPYTPLLVLSAWSAGEGSDDPHDRLHFIDVSAPTPRTVHVADAKNKLDVADVPADWPYPTYPAVIETGASVPASRRSVWSDETRSLEPPEGAPRLATLIHHQAPEALRRALPDGAGLPACEIWWRDDIRRAHVRNLENTLLTLGNTNLLLADLAGEGDETRSLVSTIDEGRAAPARIEDLRGRWSARLHRITPDERIARRGAGHIQVTGDACRTNVSGSGGGGMSLTAKLYRFTHGVSGTVLLGAMTQGDAAPGYSGWTGPWDSGAQESDLYGAVYQLSEDRSVAILNPEDPMDLMLLELTRDTKGNQ